MSFLKIYKRGVASYLVFFCNRPLAQSRLPAGGNMFLGASNRKAKSIVLQIQGLNSQVGVAIMGVACEALLIN